MEFSAWTQVLSTGGPTVLDTAVPWVAFFYGCIMVFVFESPTLVKLANERLPEPLRSQFLGHRRLGWVCLFVGGIWVLQGLWLG